jgi:nitrite reductase (cytochrome c-552)
VAAENSSGFHAPQESARILGEAIDFARQSQLAAVKAMGPSAAETTAPASEPALERAKEQEKPAPDGPNER